MKEAKRTPVPLPGSKARSKVKIAPSKTPLSQEYIASDDDSATENVPHPKKADKSRTTIGIHKANGVVQPASKPKASTKNVTTLKSTSQPKQTIKKPTSTQIETQEQSADLSSSEQSDDGDAPAKDIQTKLSGNNAKSVESSDSDSSSESSGDDSASEDALRSARKPAPGLTQPLQSQSPSQPQSYAVDFQAAQPYLPPKGFQPVPLEDQGVSRATSIFNDLQGKQVWHITAPAGVSLKDLKELAMAKAMEGDAILSYGGAEYGFAKTRTTEEGAQEILLPQKGGYRAVSASISQTLHLQAVVRLPELSSKQADQHTGSEAAASITRSTIRAPRAQVTGLKMRFFPTGFGGSDAGILGDTDDEGKAPRGTAGLGMPSELNLPSRKEKRKHVDIGGVVGASATPSKKSRKNRNPEDLQRKEERRARKEKERALKATASR